MIFHKSDLPVAFLFVKIIKRSLETYSTYLLFSKNKRKMMHIIEVKKNKKNKKKKTTVIFFNGTEIKMLVSAIKL